MAFMQNNPRLAEPAHPLLRRTFSLDRANRSLVLVRRIVADVLARHDHLLELQEQVEVLWDTPGLQRQSACEALGAMAECIRGYLDELEDIGVELRDWTLGVVDFPAVAGGRDVYLTWRHDEPEIAAWHGATEDHAVRRPLEALPVLDPSPAESLR